MNKTVNIQEKDMDKAPMLNEKKKEEESADPVKANAQEGASSNSFYRIAFDAFAFIQVLAKRKWLILTIALVFGLLGAFCSFQIPKVYTSELSLAPEASNSGLSSNISSLASMVGVDMKFGDGEDAIYPEIYPDVVSSNKFIVSLFGVKVTTKDNSLTTTYYDYLSKHQKAAFWNQWKEKLLSKLNTEDPTGGGARQTNKVDTFRLTKKEADIANGISGNITCSVDKKTSVITIQVKDQDPVVAKTMTDSVKVRLQNFIKEYRTRKARNNVAYVRQLYDEAKRRYDEARRKYASYADAHQETVLQTYQSQQEDLENEMQLQYNIYTQCVQQLQLSLAKLQEKTPVFTEIVQATVPIKHSNTPKIVIVFAFMLFATIGTVLYLAITNRKRIFKLVEVTA